MAVNTNKTCDSCGKVVYGTDRGEFIRRSNIFVNGQMGKNRVDEQTGWREVVYLTRSAQDQLAFCDAECLVAWVELQETLWDNRKTARLREEAEQDQSIRLEDSYHRENGTTPKRRGSPPPAQAPDRYSV